MRHLIYLLTVLIIQPVYAGNFDNSDKLRTFFTAPNVRHQLDELRAAGKFSPDKKNAGVSIFREPLKVKMKGVVLRDSQAPVVFVNNGNTLESRRVDNQITVNPKRVKKDTYKVPVSVNQQAIKLKPGQQWSEAKPVVKDNYQISEPKPEPEGVQESATKEIIKQVIN